MALFDNWFAAQSRATPSAYRPGVFGTSDRSFPVRATQVPAEMSPSAQVSPEGSPVMNVGPLQRPSFLPTVPGSTGKIVTSYKPNPAPSYAPPSEVSTYNALQSNAPVGIPVSKWSPTQLFTGVRTPSQWLQDVYVPGGGSAAGAEAALEQNYATPMNPYTQNTGWIQAAINAIFGPPKP